MLLLVLKNNCFLLCLSFFAMMATELFMDLLDQSIFGIQQKGGFLPDSFDESCRCTPIQGTNDTFAKIEQIFNERKGILNQLKDIDNCEEQECCNADKTSCFTGYPCPEVKKFLSFLYSYETIRFSINYNEEIEKKISRQTKVFDRLIRSCSYSATRFLNTNRQPQEKDLQIESPCFCHIPYFRSTQEFPSEISTTVTIGQVQAAQIGSRVKRNTTQSNGLSVGSVLCILFFVGGTLYFIGGMILLKVVKGATGLEMIPNYEFWKALPALIHDGIFFIGNCGRVRQVYEPI